MPKIAIITRTKNREILLKRAIFSVSQQTYQDYVHIIINDGGMPLDINALTSSISDQQKTKIQFLQNPTSKGMEAASNLAIKSSKSEMITFLDDDDSWDKNFLSVTIQYLEENQGMMGVSTASNIIIEEIIRDKVLILHARKYRPELKIISLYQTAKINTILNHAFVYRREALKTIGPYNENLPVLGDWDFNLRFLMQYDIHYIDKALTYYHIRRNASRYGNTITQNIAVHIETRNKINNALLRQDIFKGSLGLGFLVNASGDLQKNTTINKLLAFSQKVLDSSHLVYIWRKYAPNRRTKELRKTFKSLK